MYIFITYSLHYTKTEVARQICNLKYQLLVAFYFLVCSKYMYVQITHVSPLCILNFIKRKSSHQYLLPCILCIRVEYDSSLSILSCILLGPCWQHIILCSMYVIYCILLYCNVWKRNKNKCENLHLLTRSFWFCSALCSLCK